MAIAPGNSLGNFEILGAIGAGGMGEVFRARDSKLGRDVAVKVLPEAFAKQAEWVERFRREAHLLAALNHPNIAHIYGLEHSADTHYLVMELVPGETLRSRIATGPVPIDEALEIAKQIAEALEAAHEKGIIHRDLKPANIKLMPNGRVKVLDFGLAKAFSRDDAEPLQDSNSPTLTAEATGKGVILGTAAYMSPEQAKGKALDRRTDIWALGCVLYELLTAKQAFEGETVTEILGGVLKSEPDWNALPEKTPPLIRTLLRRCLQKDAGKRSRDAGEIRLQIEEALAASSAVATTIVAPPREGGSRHRWLYGGFACLIAALAGAGAMWLFRSTVPTVPPVERFVSALPANTVFAAAALAGGQQLLAISGDGRRMAYVAGAGGGGQLYIRSMDSLQATPLPGTDGLSSPFFSPDGEWVGFFQPGAIKKISAGGGAALMLCSLPGFVPLGGAWAADDTIIVGTNTSGLMRLVAAGGELQPFTTLSPGEISHRWPQFLPDGKSVIFTVQIGATNLDAEIAVQRLDSKEKKILIRGGYNARYIPTGHMVYLRAGTLMAVPFDANALEVTGNPVPVVESVLDGFAGNAQYAVSDLGSLVYVAGTPQLANLSLVWVDRKGTAQTLPAPARAYRAPRLSPDGTKVAVGIGNDVWIYDIPRDTLTRFTFENSNAGTAAVWTPDNKRIVFPSNRSGAVNLFWKPADASGPEERLTTSPNTQRIGSFSPDGRIMMLSDVAPKTASDLWWLSLQGDRKPQIFLQTPFLEASGLISPDGHWVAYNSDESGRLEIYIRPFPGPGGKWQISTEGGTEAVWSPKGNELFFRSGAQKEKMMVVDYQTQPTFSADKPRLLFEGSYVVGNQGAFYSVSPDGQRFLMMKANEQQQTSLTQINVVLNWFEELKRRVPIN